MSPYSATGRQSIFRYPTLVRSARNDYMADSPSVTTGTWHSTPAREVAEKLEASLESGLESAEASRRAEKYGPNRLPIAGQRGPLKRFLMQINNVLIYVLIGAGVGKLLLGEFLDAGIIFAVVIINAL